MPTLTEIAATHQIEYDTVEVIMRAQIVPLDDPAMLREHDGEPWNFPRRTAAAIGLACRLVISGIRASIVRTYVRAVLAWCDANRPTNGYIDVVLQFMDGVSILITDQARGTTSFKTLALIHTCDFQVTPDVADVITVLRYTE